MSGATATRPGEPERRPRNRRDAAQARRRRNRLLPLAAVAVIAFIFGVVSGAGSAEKDAVQRFVTAWTKQDFKAMHAELTDDSARRYPVDELAGAYLAAQRTGTATAIDPGSIDGPAGDVVKVKMAIRTRLFGVVDGELDFPVSNGGIQWDPHLTFPGLREGERLGRHLEVGQRAPILAANGTPLAEGQGDQRSSPLGSVALGITGEIGRPDTHQVAELQAEGYPSDVSVGISGLERAFNSRLAGTPGGQLLAVKGQGGDVPAGTAGRVLGTADTKPGQSVKTTIDPKLLTVASEALGGRAGGAAVLDAKTGEVKALAGSAYSAPAPPGSTFKIITTTAALEAKVVKLSDTFPVTDHINVGGRDLENANGEFCGGTFVEAFAESCNSVFAPLGPKIGEQHLVSTAEKFGFNQPPQLFNQQALAAVDPPESSLPTPVGSELDLGVTAIGQGKVLATPLEMATVAQTIAAHGKRSPTSIVSDPALAPDSKPVQVTTPQIAGIIKNLMIGVVNSGTGTAADLGKIQVAGKTGTAELGPKPNQPAAKPAAPGQPAPKPEQILDAWFTCFAPAEKPRIVVAVFFADANGAGGEVAAPVAREILSAAL
jgi:cell division protein FtsI/penicillin-binding protein 2